MRIFATLSYFWVLSQLMACGPDCQSTCSKIYDPSKCGIERPGFDSSELLKQCKQQCKDGLLIPGEVGDYKPNDATPRSETPTLENEQQTALWMDCVEKTACENLEKNYCAPIW